MSGTLYVVATPIGNLEDITLRALRVLREVAVIAAEDTRRTARLLQHYSISTHTTSLHEHNERRRIPGLIERLAAGESVALVSDAGTPLLSDPGMLLVAAAHEAGLRVEPIPGPSAAVAVVSAAGLPGSQILFVGFPPARSKARKAFFERLQHEESLLVFFEAPHRVRACLEELQGVMGDRVIAVGREVTKLHEHLDVRPISGHLEHLGDPRGEFTIVVSSATPGKPAGDRPAAPELRRQFAELSRTAPSRREAVRTLAIRYGLPPRQMYRLLETDVMEDEPDEGLPT